MNKPILKLRYFPKKCAPDVILVRTDENKIYYNSGSYEEPRFETLSGHDLPVGTIICGGFLENKVPNKYLRCDGTAYDVKKYAALYSMIGSTYGQITNSRGTVVKFNVPNFVSELAKFPVGGFNGDKFTSGVNRMPMGRVPISQLRSHNDRPYGGAASFLLENIHMPPHTHSVTALGTAQEIDMPRTYNTRTPITDQGASGYGYYGLQSTEINSNRFLNNDREVLEMEFFIKYD